MILVAKNFIRKGCSGIAIFPFIILKMHGLRKNSVLVNHGEIHLRQQLELLIVPFYILYGIEFLIRFCQYKNTNLAYRNISFEREAYINESDLKYLNHRYFWAFLKYLRKYEV